MIIFDAIFPTPDSRFPTPYSLLPTPFAIHRFSLAGCYKWNTSYFSSGLPKVS
ncbi:MAG: hypothetical protein F6J94_05825 [Moorea sp. SIO1F2]|uniref:hypothetical protein n=1 Tax=Moorena TaxID=1155738 RepID=UPI001300FC39|nr:MULTISPECIES: hypothetical protein [Moorena]NEN96052.1 hypothetical protein [Moorena sp. SIO3I7]NEO06295.1 hypothetical protein [Moorena sp. SIO3I8]NEP24050.1 hypothetical protein [Moorena sp. SIO3I6]NET81486.1 hypothetical protein [Moorena sp. SIO1F2]